MYRYLVVDGELNGTGIRNYYETGFIKPALLALSTEIINRIELWLIGYADEHYNGFENKDIVQQLDNEGLDIAREIKKLLPESKISYFSAGTLLQIEV